MWENLDSTKFYRVSTASIKVSAVCRKRFGSQMSTQTSRRWKDSITAHHRSSFSFDELEIIVKHKVHKVKCGKISIRLSFTGFLPRR